MTSGQERISEAAKHGFKRAIVPCQQAEKCGRKYGSFYGEKSLMHSAILDNF